MTGYANEQHNSYITLLVVHISFSIITEVSNHNFLA